MARPERRNADYFPFYAKDGRTLFLLESKYGCKGTGFFTNVMRFLTLETNHYVNIQDETDKMYFFSKCHCDEETGMDMLNIMSKTGKINKELWEIFIIISEALLESLADAYRNRKNDIITIGEIKEKYISDVRNKVTDVINPQEPVVSNVSKPQRKGKETKGKETKGNIYCRIVSHLNQKTGKIFKPTSKETKRLIDTRINAGFTENDFLTVIDNKCSKWLTDPKMIEYLRPQTLFGTKFESYLQDTPHPLHGKVSDTTMRNITVLEKWRPKDEESGNV